MTDKKAEKKYTKTSTTAPASKNAPRKSSGSGKSGGFSEAERASMKARAREVELEANGGTLKGKVKMEKELLDKIAEMPEPDRSMAEKLHMIVQANAPHLTPKTMYGMPAYANADGKVVLMFQSAAKFDTRYSSVAFQDPANLDDGAMWPIGFALKELTPAVEKRIAELVKKAVG